MISKSVHSSNFNFFPVRKTMTNNQNFSENMAPKPQPRKPTPEKAGEGNTKPAFTTLPTTRADGTSVPKPRPANPAPAGEAQTTNKTTNSSPTGKESKTSNDSLNSMKSITGWNAENKSWAELKEQEEKEKLDDMLNTTEEKEDEVVEVLEVKKKKNKGKKRPTKDKDGKPEEKQSMSWADAAKFRICTITAKNQEEDLMHEDFLHIQKAILGLVVKLEPEEMESLRIHKSGVRDGGIQLALESEKGISWFRDTIPKLSPRDEKLLGYNFYGPGEKPYHTFKAYTTEVETSSDPENVVKLLKGYNPFLRKGRLSVAILGRTKSGSVALRIRVAEALVGPLAEADFLVCYGMGTLHLSPLHGSVAENKATEEMETS